MTKLGRQLLWLILVAQCALFAACGDSDIPPRPYGCVQVLDGGCVPARDIGSVEDDRDIGFPVYWVGQEINGLEFSSLSSAGAQAPQGQSVTFDYGNCRARFGDEGCPIPLTIDTFPYCEVPFAYGGGRWQESEFRGVKRYDYPGQVVLETGPVVVHIQATNPANAGLAALALRRLTNTGGTPAEGLLAPPEEVDCLGISTED